MNKCLNCNEAIEQKKGKRKRIYCSNLCKLRHWQRQNKRKPIKNPSPIMSIAAPEPQSISLLEQLRAAESERLPDYIKSEQGRVFWQQSQRKKITELKNKLKS